MENEFNNTDIVESASEEQSIQSKTSSNRRKRAKGKITAISDGQLEDRNNIPEKISIDPSGNDEREEEGALSYTYRDNSQTLQEEWNTSEENITNVENVEKKPEVLQPNKHEKGNGNNFPSDSGQGSLQRRKNNNQKNNNSSRGRGNDTKPRFAKQIRIGQFNTGFMKNLECFESIDKLEALAETSIDFSQDVLDFNVHYVKNATQLLTEFHVFDGISDDLENVKRASSARILEAITNAVFANKRPIIAHGVLESIEGGDGLIVYASDNYRIKPQSAFVSKLFIQKYGLRRGQEITAYLHPPIQNSTCPFVLSIKDVMGLSLEKVCSLPKFKDLVPYYPTERLFLETSDDVAWDNRSMRIVDLLSPIGLGQRGLIVAPPRTGKTVLLQGIANAISKNRPDVHLIILLIDERPEEVTDFRRQVSNAEIISSTFDESADNHVHAADMVIDKARRKVEAGQHVVILLDSITRLARAHNTEQPSSGKLLSGGVDANALQAPKRFFGSARNIEGGGSLTILSTALVDTGSRMDEVIFEEFKGTGNMELHLDRTLSEKRVFPAINIERSGTRKEELLYHPEELEKIYILRRVMKDVSSVESMEMLIQRIKQTKTNTEFLLNINR